MLASAQALWPVFALLLVGFLARRYQFPGDGFWEPAEKLTYYVLFPLLLIEKLSRANLAEVAMSQLLLVLALLLASGSVLCYLLRSVLALSAEQFTSFYQGGIRFNTYVGLAVAFALYGGAGVAVSALIIAFMIPVLNLLCILVFTLHTSASAGVKGVLLTLLKNPLIIGCVVGISMSMTGIGLPLLLLPVVQLLTPMALPLGLLAVGAGLNAQALRHAGRVVWVSSVIKLLLFPLLAVFFARLLELSDLVTGLLVIFAAVPTAPSAYILARQLGGDAPMMAAIITGQTLLAMITLPLVLACF